MSAAVTAVAAVAASPLPTSNYGPYRLCVLEQMDWPPAAWTFKADPRYRIVLEHVTQPQGEEYAQVAQQAAGERWGELLALLPQIAAENDRYGCPAQDSFPALGLACSPSNLRYFCQAIQIWRHLERLGLRHVEVVELGGGYGGLALYLHRLAPQFPAALGRYSIVDLPEVGRLQAAYLGALGVPVETVNGLRPDLQFVPNPDRFLVSNYAWSEFDRETHDWYRERLVRGCAHGFIVWNFHQVFQGFEKPLGGPLYPFVDAPLTTEPERPSTGTGNKVVTW